MCFLHSPGCFYHCGIYAVVLFGLSDINSNQTYQCFGLLENPKNKISWSADDTTVFLKRAVHSCDNKTWPAASGLYLEQAHLSGQQTMAPIESDCYYLSFFSPTRCIKNMSMKHQGTMLTYRSRTQHVSFKSNSVVLQFYLFKAIKLGWEHHLCPFPSSMWSSVCSCASCYQTWQHVSYSLWGPHKKYGLYKCHFYSFSIYWSKHPHKF